MPDIAHTLISTGGMMLALQMHKYIHLISTKFVERLGIELRALCLLSKLSITQTITLSPFAYFILFFR
jgi:hypothetical protein